MPAVRGKFSPLLAPGLASIFFRTLKDMPTEYTSVINTKKSRRAYEEEYKVAGLGSMFQKAEGAVYTFDEPLSGDTIRYTHLTYGLGYRVTEEMMEDDLYGIMKKMSSELARSAHLNKEVHGHAPYNNAFDSNFPGLDGQPLISASHPLLGGGTLSNLVTGDFSLDALQEAVELFENLTDDRGFKVLMKPKRLLHSPSNIWEVNKVLGSEYEPNTSDNNINVVRSKYGITPHLDHYFTDSDAWFLVADTKELDVKMWIRVDDQFRNSDDPLNGDAIFTVRHRHSNGHGDFRGVVGSAGA